MRDKKVTEVNTLPISSSKPIKVKLTVISDNKEAITTSIDALVKFLEVTLGEVGYTRPAWDFSPSTKRYKFVIDISVKEHSKQEVDETFDEYRNMAVQVLTQRNVTINFHWDIS